MLAAPTNVCFVGAELDRVVAANYNRRHLTILDLGLRAHRCTRPSDGRSTPCDRHRHSSGGPVSREISELRAGIVGNGFHRRRPRRCAPPARRRGHRSRGLDARACGGEANRAGLEAYEALLADERVDVVHLTTPNHLHYPQVKQALEAGQARRLREAPRAARRRSRPSSSSSRRRAASCTARTSTSASTRCAAGAGARSAPARWEGLERPRRLPPGLARYCRPTGTGASSPRRPAGSAPSATSARTGSISRSSSRARGSWRSSPTWRPRSRSGSGRRARSRPSRQRDDVEREDAPMTTEDIAHILLRYEGGARGSLVVSQVCAGRKNSPRYQVDGSRAPWRGTRAPRGALARPPRRARTSSSSAIRRSCTRRPRARHTCRSPPRGLRRHVPRALPRRLRGRSPRRPPGRSGLPDLRATATSENVLCDAVALSERRGSERWVEVTSEARLADRSVPRPDARGGRRLGLGEGFQMLEVACWPPAAARTRRYARREPHRRRARRRRRVHAIFERPGSRSRRSPTTRTTSTPTPSARGGKRHLRKVIDAAQALGVAIVGTFVGRDKTRTIPENLERVQEGLAAARRLRGRARRDDRDRELPDDLQRRRVAGREQPGLLACDLGRDVLHRSRPRASAQPRSITSRLADDRLRAGRLRLRDRIVHVHAKDLEIDRDGLYRHGTLSGGIGWQVPRLPGLGEVRWDRFLAALYATGYDHVCLDRARGPDASRVTEELVKRGFLSPAMSCAPYLHVAGVEHELDPRGGTGRGERALPLLEGHRPRDERLEVDASASR